MNPAERYRDDRWCIGCGEKNPRGFRLFFHWEEKVLCSETVFSKEHQGFENVVHGGVLGLLLDEMMVNWFWLQKIHAVTAEYRVRLLKPCPVGRKVFLKAWGEMEGKKLRRAQAHAVLDDQTPIARASAVCRIFT